MVFHVQLAHGSPTRQVRDFTNVKQLYESIAKAFALVELDLSPQGREAQQSHLFNLIDAGAHALSLSRVDFHLTVLTLVFALALQWSTAACLPSHECGSGPLGLIIPGPNLAATNPDKEFASICTAPSAPA